MLVLMVVSAALVVTALLAAGLHRTMRFLAARVVPGDSHFVAAGVVTVVLSIYLGPSALFVAIVLFLHDLRHDGTTLQPPMS